MKIPVTGRPSTPIGRNPAGLVALLLLLLLAACQPDAETPVGAPTVAPTGASPVRPTTPAATDVIAATLPAAGCLTDGDCALAVRIDRCCPCPVVMSAAEIEQAENIVRYEPGMSVGALLPAECENADCDGCPPAPLPACLDNVCRAAESAALILERCPTCVDQAASAALRGGDAGQALTLCEMSAAPGDCLAALFAQAVAAGELSAAEQACGHPAAADRSGCLTVLGPLVAGEDVERGLALCMQTPEVDARRAVCLMETARVAATVNLSRAREICAMLPAEMAAECLQELE